MPLVATRREVGLEGWGSLGRAVKNQSGEMQVSRRGWEQESHESSGLAQARAASGQSWVPLHVSLISFLAISR